MADIPSAKTTGYTLLRHDIVLIGIMAVLAACGLIYEYLLAHYAGRVIGSTDTAVYSMIGIMIVAMGIGAFLAKWIKNPYRGFSYLELMIGVFGGSAILLIASIIGLSYTLPQQLQAIYGIDSSIAMEGGIIAIIQKMASYTPYVFGFILGVMIGVEIPLIARIREDQHQTHLKHNMGTVYGADYIGAGIGAAIWVTICLKLDIMVAALGTASINILMGLVFLYHYQHKIKQAKLLWVLHIAVLLFLLVLAMVGVKMTNGINATFFKDQVVYTKVTPYQHLTVAKRHAGKGLPQVYSLYINGRLQFSSNDEMVYHSYLTYPAMLASARHDNILIIGGGDGLALRDVLKWGPDSVTLIDLDKAMIDLFSGKDQQAPKDINDVFLSLNQSSFLDKRVLVINQDAFIEVESMISRNTKFDTIIVDLPDPSHPDLNKLYSNYFYIRLKELLNGDGAIVVQSTSPYHAKKAFISIGKSVADAGFITQQYHANVPTFGEWGWTIATQNGKSALDRIKEVETLPIEDRWLSKAMMEGAFVFSPSFYDSTSEIKINKLGSHQLYYYHRDAWTQNEGLFLY
ncbi:MAG: polyamine aminopropyltransferase [Gammaproteobacteria bacterium]|nr:polyamine aminopropyltransferase [Gammaproteobacteria bacterium]